MSEDLTIKSKTKGMPSTVDSTTESSVIGSSTTERNGKSNKSGSVAVNNFGAIGSPKAENFSKPTKTDVEGKVAVFSTKNVTWPGVGSVTKGYNIVSQEKADKWATRSHIRVATPQEVAQEFGL
jgi:hypothetical protein